MGCFYHYCPYQEERLDLTEEDIQLKQKRGTWMKCGNSISRIKVSRISNFEHVISGNYTTDVSVTDHLSEKIIPIQVSIELETVKEDDKFRRIVWLRAV